MTILAEIAYWLLSILAALLVAWTTVLLVAITYGQELPGWFVHALSLALLAIFVWFGWRGGARMMILAKIVYWLSSILAAWLVAWTAALLVGIPYGRELPDWWLHALSLALLAICVWFVGWVFRYLVRRIWGSTTAPGQTTPKSMA